MGLSIRRGNSSQNVIPYIWEKKKSREQSWTIEAYVSLTLIVI